MIPAWTYLDEPDRATFRASVAFLKKRLEEESVIDWALHLKPHQHIERLAIQELLYGPDGLALKEPWATAWRLIDESWVNPAIEEGPSTAIYDVQQRLAAGDRSGGVVSSIVDLVKPRLMVEPIGAWRWELAKKPRRPKTYDHLISARLTSGGLVDLNVVDLAVHTDVDFLTALGNALEAAVAQGLAIARRLGWNEQRGIWQLGELGWVCYTNGSPRGRSSEDPDAYHRGIAPSVKLLFAIVERISELEMQSAEPFVRRWHLETSPIHTRLWSAAARNHELVTVEQVGTFLTRIDDRHFWDLSSFPEIAELRALRFGALSHQVQSVLAKRMRKGPPRNQWPRRVEAADIKNAKLSWSVRELMRVLVAGGTLPSDERAWMDANISRFPELTNMSINYGFPRSSEVYSVPPNPDPVYGTLAGGARLSALEGALSSSRGGWHDGPAERANDWLMQEKNAQLVLGDLESGRDDGDEFVRVWERFGWAHSPNRQGALDAEEDNLQDSADRVLTLLAGLSEATLSGAIEGISTWLSAWNKHVVTSALCSFVWLRIWPLAVGATNSASDYRDDADLSVSAVADDDESEPVDLDTLNSPTGKLVGVFIAACPSLADVPQPFDRGSEISHMRDALAAAPGRSGLIVRHRLIESLPYFLRADHNWSQEHLIDPLMNDDGASLTLWRAISRRTHFRNVLAIIGSTMAERATDLRLDRETRRSLVFSLVVECLHAFRDGRDPAVPHQRIQQMLRTLDDEVRASAANTVQKFVEDLSANEAATSPTAESLFRSAVSPFLQSVWPQERSLSSPGVSRALADIPATSGEAFAEAVGVIQRFLVPFECWSMLDYGLRGADDGDKKFVIINDSRSAKALLELLDLTIGSSDGAIVPFDLSDALDHIRTVNQELTAEPIYRRLSTLARR